MSTVKDRNGKDLREAREIRGGGRNTQKKGTKKVLMTQILPLVWSLTKSQTPRSVKSSGS